MQDAIRAGAILVKNDTSLPAGLYFQSEPCVPGWSLVKDFDGCRLDREIGAKGWTFFCLVGEFRAVVFGINQESMVRKAVKRLVENPRSKRFNSLEITNLVSKRFLGVRYVSVGCESRHIQESMFLCSAADGQESGRTKRVAAEISTRASRAAAGFASEETTAQKGIVTEPSL